MVIDVLSGKEKSPTTDRSLRWEALASEHLPVSQVPSWFCPPHLVQSRASLSNCLNQRPVTTECLYKYGSTSPEWDCVLVWGCLRVYIAMCPVLENLNAELCGKRTIHITKELRTHPPQNWHFGVQTASSIYGRKASSFVLLTLVVAEYL